MCISNPKIQKHVIIVDSKPQLKKEPERIGD